MNILPPPQITWREDVPNPSLYWMRFLYTEFILELEEEGWTLKCFAWGNHEYEFLLSSFYEPDPEVAKQKAMTIVLQRLRSELHDIETAVPGPSGPSVWERL